MLPRFFFAAEGVSDPTSHGVTLKTTPLFSMPPAVVAPLRVSLPGTRRLEPRKDFTRTVLCYGEIVERGFSP